MSSAVHDKQPLQTWSDNLRISTTRKAPWVRMEETLSPALALSPQPPQLREEPAQKEYQPSHHKSKATNSMFLIDGKLPMLPDPLSYEKSLKTYPKPTRDRSHEKYGLVMELIEEVYPPLVCPVCYRTASVRHEMETHMKSEHRGVKAFNCVDPNCDQSYSGLAGIRHHLVNSHAVSLANPALGFKERQEILQSKRLPPSPHAQSKKRIRQKFVLPPALQQKLDQVYRETVCPCCQKEFKRKTHVVQHMVAEHHDEEPYKCIVKDCTRNRTYFTRIGLTYHLAMKHANPNHTE